MRTMYYAALCMSLAFPGAASADVQVRFVEGAPKDRFEISLADSCPLGAGSIEIDLSSAAGGLVFDITASGAGVEVFQPFELVSGSEIVGTLPTVRDGDQRVSLSFDGLAQSQMIAFTVDVDDTGGGREITVNGAEIMGADVVVRTVAGSWSGRFDETALARVQMSACQS